MKYLTGSVQQKTIVLFIATAKLVVIDAPLYGSIKLNNYLERERERDATIKYPGL